jgi:hypothetical protein
MTARCWRLVLGACCTALCLGLAPRVLAQAVPSYLAWQRPAASQCPSSAALQGDVEALLGQRVFVAERAAQVILRGTIEDDAGGVRVVIAASDATGAPRGVRTLEAPAGACASLRRPLAVVLLMLLEQAAEPVGAPSPLRRDQRLGPSLGLLTGVLPRATTGVGAVYTVALRERLQLRADAAYFLPVTAATASGVGARFQAYGAGVGLCPRLWRSPRALSLWLCGEGRLGGLHAQGRGLSEASGHARLLAQAGLALALTAPVVRGLALELSAAGLATPTRPRFFYERSDQSTAFVHRPAPIGVFVRLSLTIAAR